MYEYMHNVSIYVHIKVEAYTTNYGIAVSKKQAATWILAQLKEYISAVL